MVTRVFVGVDKRQPLGYNVLQHSIHQHAKGRVIVEPLMIDKLPIKRRGLTDFTFSRFLPPWLCDYEGVSIFMDADIVVTGDVADLAAQADGKSAVQVMQNQQKFEWASVMLFNNAQCKALTPEYVDDEKNRLLDLTFGPVGRFSDDWNHCVGYTEPKEAKLYHYTQGLPCWHETRGLPEDVHWLEAHRDMNRTVSWGELMATSVHAKHVLKRMLKGYGFNV